MLTLYVHLQVLNIKFIFHLLIPESICHQYFAHFVILLPGVISLHLNIQVLLNFTNIYLRLFGKHVLWIPLIAMVLASNCLQFTHIKIRNNEWQVFFFLTLNFNRDSNFYLSLSNVYMYVVVQEELEFCSLEFCSNR